MDNIVKVMTEEEFKKHLKTKKPIVVEFFAGWCAPCKMQLPILKEFKLEIGDKAQVIKVDVDQNQSIANFYGVNSIPTIAVFKGGELKEKAVGLTTKANLSEMLIKYL